MPDFLGNRTAAYNKPNNRIMGQKKPKVIARPVATTAQMQSLAEIIEIAGRMRQATSEAVYHIRRYKLFEAVRNLK